MNSSSPRTRTRVLVADRDTSFRQEVREILSATNHVGLPERSALTSSGPRGKCWLPHDIQVDQASSIESLVTLVRAARHASDPIALAFLGVGSEEHGKNFQPLLSLLDEDSDLHLLLCVAEGHESWVRTILESGRGDRLLVLRKPLDPLETLQVTQSLCEKWHLSRHSRGQSAELEELHRRLEAEVERRQRVENQIRFDALHDNLTRLPNRTLLLERIEHCIRRKRREENYHFALVFLDLDDFKRVNDNQGHHAGDQLLVEISQRILSCVRSTDCASRARQNTAARLGGDEFVILLDGVDGATGAIFVTERILEEVSRPFIIEGTRIQPSASAGIAVGSDKQRSAEDLLRDADIALYDAKRKGKERLSIFDERLHQQILKKIRLESELREAIVAQQLVLHYQPIVDIKADKIHGFEALVRWNHPQHGRLLPSAFLPLAEEKGLIRDLGLWVLDEACRKTAEWRRHFPAYSSLTVSVNFAGGQLEDPDLMTKVERVLHQHGLNTSDLNLELTETLLMDAARPGNDSLDRLEEHALNLHMDDFGTGLSSLSYLNRLPIRALKLDREFVRGVNSNKSCVSMLHAVLAMAHARGLKVIAEGVETPEQFATLRAAGCDYGQGYYFSRPLDASGIEEMLRTNNQRSIA